MLAQAGLQAGFTVKSWTKKKKKKKQPRSLFKAFSLLSYHVSLCKTWKWQEIKGNYWTPSVIVTTSIYDNNLLGWSLKMQVAPVSLCLEISMWLLEWNTLHFARCLRVGTSLAHKLPLSQYMWLSMRKREGKKRW